MSVLTEQTKYYLCTLTLKRKREYEHGKGKEANLACHFCKWSCVALINTPFHVAFLLAIVHRLSRGCSRKHTEWSC